MALSATDKAKIIEEYRLEERDTGSPEVQVALLTNNINVLQEHFNDNPNTVLGNEIKELRVALKEVFTENRYWGWYLEDKRTWDLN